MEDALLSFGLWCRSIGLTPFERVGAEQEIYGHHRGGGVGRPSSLDAVEELIPPFDSPDRRFSLTSSIAHVVASIVGGGTFFLPETFERIGYTASIVLVICVAVMSERSLYLLCLTARRAGVSSYPEIAKVAFGNWAQHTLSVLLFVFLLCVLVAYFMLIAALWTPLVQDVLPSQQKKVPNFLILLISLVLLGPFLVQREFRCIRLKCYAMLLGLFLLCLALGLDSKSALLAAASQLSTKMSAQKVGESLLLQFKGDGEEIRTKVEFASEIHVGDFLYTLPIVAMSFTSSSNILSVQAKLRQPSKERLSFTIRAGVAASALLMTIFGVLGSLSIGNFESQDNFLESLSNLSTSLDARLVVLFGIGRFGCGIFMLFATAMVMPLCRLSLLQVIDFSIIQGTDESTCKTLKEMCPEDCCDEGAPDLDEETCMTFPSISTWSTDKTPDVFVPIPNEETRLLPRIEEEFVAPVCNIYNNPFAHYASTAGIAIVCYLLAIALSWSTISVSVVWRLVGATMAFALDFLVPPILFIKIQRRHPIYPGTNAWIVYCWIVVAVSGVATISCTVFFVFDQSLSVRK
jgi:amino acid permease